MLGQFTSVRVINYTALCVFVFPVVKIKKMGAYSAINTVAILTFQSQVVHLDLSISGQVLHCCVLSKPAVWKMNHCALVSPSNNKV